MTTRTDQKNATDVEIGARVFEALITKRVSAKSLAQELGIGYSTLLRTLDGDRSFTVRQIGHIANKLNIQPSALLTDALAARDAA